MDKSSKYYLIALSLIVVTLLVFGCGSPPSAPPVSTPAGGDGNPAPTEETFSLRLSHPFSPSHPWQAGAEKFVELLQIQVGDRVHVDIYPNASLSEQNEKTMTEQALLGTLDIVITPSPNVDKAFSVFGYPFSFENRDKVYALLATKPAVDLLNSSEARGLKGLCYWENGFRQLTNSIKTIKSPADMVGLKIRVPQSAEKIATITSLGANPVSVSLGELYVALSQGTADGQENPLTTIYNERYYEVQKYCTVFNYQWSPGTFGINTDVWNDLPADIQAAIQSSATEAGQYTSSLIAEQDNTLVKELADLGMEMYIPTPEEMQLFKDATNTPTLYAEYEEIVGAEVLRDIRAELEKLQ
jgi:tripartite ATP-independent transporter DctP family solute receptor